MTAAHRTFSSPALCLFLLLLAGWPAGLTHAAESADPDLNVYIRVGKKTHGPGAHDYPAFLKQWEKRLARRGVDVDGSLHFPSAKRLKRADVLMIYMQGGGTMTADQRERFDRYLERGGGVVVLHSGITSDKPEWFAKRVGGAFEAGHSKWSVNSPQGVYFQSQTHPITRGVANFDLPEEEIYFNLRMAEGVNVLATSYHKIDVIAPQMWTHRYRDARAFVWLTGHFHKTFERPHVRALLMRGIAWAADREADLLLTDEERASLDYPPGGPTEPAQARGKIEIHPDFNMKLVAAEPRIANPISLAWGSRGRLWVAEAREYPFQEDKDRPGRDRISILRDDDGDGRADAKTVFARDLALVTSILPYREGVLVTAPPDLLYLADTDGDDRADERRTILTGFGTRDTHATVNHMRWGLDGWIYATLGYSNADLRTPDGKKFGHFSAGVLRFKPDGSAVEKISSKGGNAWGVDFTADGELFWTQATSGEHLLHVVLPRPQLEAGSIEGVHSYHVTEDHKKLFPAMKAERPAYVQVAPTGIITAGAGCTIYSGGAWPEAFKMNHFISDPTVWLTHRDVLRREGVSYVASRGREKTEFIRATDPWFCPVHHRVGPDGAMYVADFYSQAVSHNDIRLPKDRHGPGHTAIRPDRDSRYGRIWRVNHKEAESFKPPRLDQADPRELVRAMAHPNRWRRMTAQRLLIERGKDDIAPALSNLLNSSRPGWARLHALWTLFQLDALSKADLLAALDDPSATIRKNACRVITERGEADVALRYAITHNLAHEDAQVRLSAAVALRASNLEGGAIARLVDAYARADNDWMRSAVLGTVNELPAAGVRAAMGVGTADDFAAAMMRRIGETGDASAAASMVRLFADAPISDKRKARLLRALSTSWSGAAPEIHDPLRGAFEKLLKSNARVAAAAVPLAADWNTGGDLDAPLRSAVGSVRDLLEDPNLDMERRAELARGLLKVEAVRAQARKVIGALLRSEARPATKRPLVRALGDLKEADAAEPLIEAYPHLDSELQRVALDLLLRRPGGAGRLVRAIESGALSPAQIGPGGVQRLREYPQEKIAEAAREALAATHQADEEKRKRIAELLPKVRGGGDPSRGEQVFQACLTCHSHDGKGRNLGPSLRGVGAHDPAALLTAIVAPNESVAPAYTAQTVQTRDGKSYYGILLSRSGETIELANQAGRFTLPRKNVRSIRSTGKSLMPEGFGGLGAEKLADLFAYLRKDAGRFRFIDLAGSFTADTRYGTYAAKERRGQSVQFARYGAIEVGGVPFRVVAPGRTPGGRNVVVLRGGKGFAETLPRRVEIEVNLDRPVQKLHFLGGVAGWGHPWGDKEQQDVPAMKAVVHGGKGEETIVMRNGREFADYNRRIDVPGSKFAPGVAEKGQLRWFTKELSRPRRIDRIVLESYDNHLAPTVVAITAELAGPSENARNRAPNAEAAAPRPRAERVLIVGGGTSHDFDRWWGRRDAATLADARPPIRAAYLDRPKAVDRKLDDRDALLLANNKAIPGEATRKAILDFVHEGGGLGVLHAAAWYNWADWPAYNRTLVAGGARGHVPLSEFEVVVEKPDHPVMEGVRRRFRIVDELYRYQHDENGPEIEVLARGVHADSGQSYPVVWIVQNRNANGRIVCNTLGHDGRAHKQRDYQRILTNTVRWITENQKETP